MFPAGFPEELTLIFTLALKKAALRDTVYLFQISDQQGYPQVEAALHLLTVALHVPVALSLALTPSFVDSCLSSRLTHFPLWFIFSRAISSILSTIFIPRVFCPLSLFPRPPLFCSSLSFTFIAIRVCSTMTHGSQTAFP